MVKRSLLANTTKLELCGAVSACNSPSGSSSSKCCPPARQSPLQSPSRPPPSSPAAHLRPCTPAKMVNKARIWAALWHRVSAPTQIDRAHIGACADAAASRAAARNRSSRQSTLSHQLCIELPGGRVCAVNNEDYLVETPLHSSFLRRERGGGGGAGVLSCFTI